MANITSTHRGAIAGAQDCQLPTTGSHEGSWEAIDHQRRDLGSSSQAEVGLPGRLCGDHNLSIISWSHAADEQSQLDTAEQAAKVPH